jgi:hypothetical protein
VAVLRTYLVVALVCLTAYTLVVGSSHGWNLLPIFFSNIGDMAWPGQFNVDFMSFLGLAAIWVAWRHRFSGGGIALAVLAFFGGMMFLAPYLLWASVQPGATVETVLVGGRPVR